MEPTHFALGPLTTPFTYPSSCTSSFLACEYCSIVLQAQLCGTHLPALDPHCWPTPSTGINSTQVLSGFYSPGFSCPIGFTTACSATTSGTERFRFGVPPTGSQTAVGCCPSGFECTNVRAQDDCNGHECTLTLLVSDFPLQRCISIVRSTVYEALMCSFGKIISVQRTVPGYLTATPTYVEWNTILKTMTEVNGHLTKTMTEVNGHLTKTITSTLISGQELRSTKVVANLPEISVFAPLIQMMHQPTSSLNTSSDTETATVTGIETGMTTGITTESHSTLSTRARTGIGFGVGMFVLVVIGISLFFFNRRRRKTQPAEPTQEDSYVSPHDESFELASNRAKVELPVNEEAAVTSPPKEENVLHELPG